MKTVLVIDGQGGKLGKLLVEALKDLPGLDLVCVGTNSIATVAMLKAGAPAGATGENPVVVNAQEADIIAGPIGMLCANALLGEITPKMAAAIAQSPAHKVLIPSGRCLLTVAGCQEMSMAAYVADAVEKIKNLL